MISRVWLMAAAFVAAIACVVWVPWKIHVRQKGDDINVPWGYRPIFDEGAFSPQEMALFVSEKTGFDVAPADVEAVVDYPRVYLQLVGLGTAATFAWLMLGEAGRLNERLRRGRTRTEPVPLPEKTPTPAETTAPTGEPTASSASVSLPAVLMVVAASFLTGSPVKAAPAAESWPALTSHAAPKALPPDAKTTDWPRFLGARDEPVSDETQLSHDFEAEGPPLVWEVTKGRGYTSPAIVGGKLVLFHRVEDAETTDCLDPVTGKRFWTHADPVTYRDRYGYSDGPRASPVIDGDKVFTYGVTSRLTCLELASGKVVWQRDCAKEDGVPQYFFGTGTTPLVQGDLLIVDLGGDGGKDIAGFEKTTGKLKWTAKTGWGASYASPIPAGLPGKNRVLVFQGGEGDESNASKGGLVCLNPADGKVDDTFPWRATRYTSVNASSPLRCGDGRFFVSQAYVDRDSPCNGGAMVQLGADGKFKTLWKDEKLGCHWMTPVVHEGHLYAFAGEKDRQCQLVCYEVETGAPRWATQVEHEIRLPDGKPLTVGLMRGSLLKVDGGFLTLGEWGTLAWLDLTPQGCTRKATSQLFVAPHGAWTLPAVSRGLLYVSQNEVDQISGKPRRLLCYDLRAAKK